MLIVCEDTIRLSFFAEIILRLLFFAEIILINFLVWKKVVGYVAGFYLTTV